VKPTFLKELLLLRQTHLLVNPVVPHVGGVERRRLVVHVLRHHGHPVGEPLCAAGRSPAAHAAAVAAPAAGHRLGVAAAPRQPGFLGKKMKTH
jgi:hypothetical protein